MDRRIQTRVVDTVHVAMGVLIEKDASVIWWITLSPQTLGTIGEILIYDGFDAGGKLVWQIGTGYARNYNFIPPIPCDYGIYVVSDVHIESYTIAWRPRSWPRKVA